MPNREFSHIPAPVESLNFISSAEQRYEITLGLSDKVFQVSTNSFEFSERMRDHFRMCRQSPNDGRGVDGEIAFCYVPSFEQLGSTTIRTEFNKIDDVKHPGWIGRQGSYSIYYQPPDLLTYRQENTNTIHCFFGDLGSPLEGETKSSRVVRNGSAYFSMVCDHFYLLLAELKNGLCLHCACVVLEGKTILLAGESGSGKSTAALSLLQQGATLLTDEIVLFYYDEDKVQVEGLPIAPYVVGDAQIRINDLYKNLGSKSAEKSPVDMSGAKGHFGSSEKYTVDYILFFEPCSDRPVKHSLYGLEPFDAMDLINQQSLGYNIPKLAGLRTRALLELVASCRSLRFRPGSSIETMYSFLAESLCE